MRSIRQWVSSGINWFTVWLVIVMVVRFWAALPHTTRIPVIRSHKSSTWIVISNFDWILAALPHQIWIHPNWNHDWSHIFTLQLLADLSTTTQCYPSTPSHVSSTTSATNLTSWRSGLNVDLLTVVAVSHTIDPFGLPSACFRLALHTQLPRCCLLPLVGSELSPSGRCSSWSQQPPLLASLVCTKSPSFLGPWDPFSRASQVDPPRTIPGS